MIDKGKIGADWQEDEFDAIVEDPCTKKGLLNFEGPSRLANTLVPVEDILSGARDSLVRQEGWDRCVTYCISFGRSRPVIDKSGVNMTSYVHINDQPSLVR